MNEYKKNIEKLTELQYEVTQNKGTEKPFDNEYNDEYRDGIYVDVVSKKVLFSSKDKFNSGSGWPSFTKPVSTSNIKESIDLKYGMVRKEVSSTDANTHLGHVFDDGPDNQLRYCINSASLLFIPKEEMATHGYKEYLYIFNNN